MVSTKKCEKTYSIKLAIDGIKTAFSKTIFFDLLIYWTKIK